MITEALILVVVFWSLALWNARTNPVRASMLSRGRAEWALDLVGLTIHGAVVPLVQTFVVAALLWRVFPSARGSMHIPGALAFAFNFVAVDYAYYWNHRLLHHPRLWRFHALHHSGPTFDVFNTSRNSALTTFLILYVWVNGAAVYLLADPAPYVWGVVASNALDILRHARLRAWPRRLPFSLLISPRDHAWHHSREVHGVNFGGNFALWDKLHGTYHTSSELPRAFGAPVPRGRLWKAFWRGVA